jgi:MFS family permease
MAVIPLYFNYRGLNYLEIGLISSLGSVMTILLPLLAGRAADVWSKKKMVLLSQIFSFTLAPLYIFANNLLSLLSLQLLVPSLYGVSESVSSAIMLDNAKVGKAGINLAILRSSAVGWSIGSFTTGFIIQNYGFEYVFIFMASFYLVAAFLILGLKEMKPEMRVIHKSGPRFINLHVLSFLALIVLILSTMPAFYSFLPLYLKNELKVPENLIPLIFTITPLGEIPITLVMGKFSDRFGRRKAVFLCLLAYPIRWTAIMMLTDFSLILPVQILHGFTFAGLNATSIAYLADIVPADSRGVISGAFSSSFSLALAIGGYALGFTAQNYGFKTMYLQAVITSLLAIVLFLITMFKKPYVKASQS